MAKSFNEEIKNNAIDTMFSLGSIPDSLLLKTIQKESLEGYKKKVNFNFKKIFLNLFLEK